MDSKKRVVHVYPRTGELRRSFFKKHIQGTVVREHRMWLYVTVTDQTSVTTHVVIVSREHAYRVTGGQEWDEAHFHNVDDVVIQQYVLSHVRPRQGVKS